MTEAERGTGTPRETERQAHTQTQRQRTDEVTMSNVERRESEEKRRRGAIVDVSTIPCARSVDS